MLTLCRPNSGRVNGGNGDLLQEDLCPHGAAPRTFVFSAPDSMAGLCGPTPLLETPGHSQASLAQSIVGSLLLSPGSWCTQGFVSALQESVSPVLWKFRNETPLVFKVKFPGSSMSSSLGSSSDPQVGNLLWALELSQQFENFLGIVVLQCVGHLLSGFMVGLMATSSKRTYATLSVLQEVYSYFHIHFVI